MPLRLRPSVALWRSHSSVTSELKDVREEARLGPPPAAQPEPSVSNDEMDDRAGVRCVDCDPVVEMEAVVEFERWLGGGGECSGGSEEADDVDDDTEETDMWGEPVSGWWFAGEIWVTVILDALLEWLECDEKDEMGGRRMFCFAGSAGPTSCARRIGASSAASASEPAGRAIWSSVRSGSKLRRGWSRSGGSDDRGGLVGAGRCIVSIA